MLFTEPSANSKDVNNTKNTALKILIVQVGVNLVFLINRESKKPMHFFILPWR
jgi:hypothetical protein